MTFRTLATQLKIKFVEINNLLKNLYGCGTKKKCMFTYYSNQNYNKSIKSKIFCGLNFFQIKMCEFSEKDSDSSVSSNSSWSVIQDDSSEDLICLSYDDGNILDEMQPQSPEYAIKCERCFSEDSIELEVVEKSSSLCNLFYKKYSVEINELASTADESMKIERKQSRNACKTKVNMPRKCKLQNLTTLSIMGAILSVAGISFIFMLAPQTPRVTQNITEQIQKNFTKVSSGNTSSLGDYDLYLNNCKELLNVVDNVHIAENNLNNRETCPANCSTILQSLDSNTIKKECSARQVEYGPLTLADFLKQNSYIHQNNNEAKTTSENSVSNSKAAINVEGKAQHLDVSSKNNLKTKNTKSSRKVKKSVGKNISTKVNRKTDSIATDKTVIQLSGNIFGDKSETKTNNLQDIPVMRVQDLEGGSDFSQGLPPKRTGEKNEKNKVTNIQKDVKPNQDDMKLERSEDMETNEFRNINTIKNKSIERNKKKLKSSPHSFLQFIQNTRKENKRKFDKNQGNTLSKKRIRTTPRKMFGMEIHFLVILQDLVLMAWLHKLNKRIILEESLIRLEKKIKMYVTTSLPKKCAELTTQLEELELKKKKKSSKQKLFDVIPIQGSAKRRSPKENDAKPKTSQSKNLKKQKSKSLVVRKQILKSKQNELEIEQNKQLIKSPKRKEFLEELKKMRHERIEFFENLHKEKDKIVKVDIFDANETMSSSSEDSLNADQETMEYKNKLEKLRKYWKTKQKYLDKRIEICKLLKKRISTDTEHEEENEIETKYIIHGVNILDNIINGVLGTINHNETVMKGSIDLRQSLLNSDTKKNESSTDIETKSRSTSLSDPDISSTESPSGSGSTSTCPFEFPLVKKCKNLKQVYEWFFGNEGLDIEKRNNLLWCFRREIAKQGNKWSKYNPRKALKEKVFHRQL